MTRPLFILAVAASSCVASAASMNDMDHGPFVSWTIRGESGSVTYKGIAIQTGQSEPAAICFDTDLLRFSAGWVGGFLRWYPERDGLERNPTIDGRIHFRNGAGPGWTTSDSFADPRSQPYGPLPETAGRYRGLFLHGTNVVLCYSIGDCEILEAPGFIRLGTEAIFTRTLNLSKTATRLTARVLECQGRDARLFGAKAGLTRGTLRIVSESENRLLAFDGLPSEAEWRILEGHLCLRLPTLTDPRRLRIWIGAEPLANLAEMENRLRTHLSRLEPLPDLAPLCRGGPARWGDALKTKAVAGRDDGALAVDTLTVPKVNPWRSWLRFGGLDFLSADRALLGSVSGDVWLVSGLQNPGGELSWKRFATGLYQPLGLKVVNGQVYVLGRDQITRLRDLNGDDEADAYENFSNGVMVAENFHSFTLNLETDSRGNFYFAHGAPWPPEVRTPHQGILFQLSPDGRTLRPFADGLRGPNGMAIGPNDQIVYTDNEGSNGVEMTFSEPLAPEESSDPQNFSIEQWNYRWIERYGSPQYSAQNPEREGHDPVPVEAVRLSSDGQTIFLQTPPLKPVMQMKVAWNIRAADGTPVRNELYQTINAVP